MIRKSLAALIPLALAPFATSHAICDGLEYGMALHVAPANYSGCDGIDDEGLACEVIDPAGEPDQQQFVWVVAYGWGEIPGWPAADAIGGSIFAVHYPPSVSVTGWSLCTGGSQIPVDNPLDGTWPQSDTGIAVTWPGGSYASPTGYAKIGFLVVDSGSVGPIEITDHAQLEEVQLTSGFPDIFSFDVPPAGWSIADVDGSTGTACRSCVISPTPVHDTTWSGVKSAFRN